MSRDVLWPPGPLPNGMRPPWLVWTEGFCKLGVVKLFAPIEHASFMSEAAALSASGSVVRVHHTDQTERV